MTLLQSWIVAVRPKTLAASFSPVVLGAFLAPSLNWVRFTVTLLFALTIQIGTNLANDYFDCIQGADTPERKGPLRASSSGLISLKKMKMAFSLFFLLAFLCSCYLSFFGGVFMFWTGVLAIFLGIFYTATPFSLAYLGLSEIFVLLFFGGIASFGAYYLQTNQVALFPFIIGLGPGFISCSLLISNNLRDVEEDRKAGKKTLVVRFGKAFGRGEYLFFLFTSPLFLFLPPFWGKLPFSYCLSLLLYVPLFFFIKKALKVGEEKLLEQTAPFLPIYTLFFLSLKIAHLFLC